MKSRPTSLDLDSIITEVPSELKLGFPAKSRFSIPKISPSTSTPILFLDLFPSVEGDMPIESDMLDENISELLGARYMYRPKERSLVIELAGKKRKNDLLVQPGPSFRQKAVWN
ncbi:hypothetical protein EG328_008993 [Venturia inaequalis]|uniref:Uncharacterized protein n=1 Tax=Venturia inaequalis TaxID=5025 RepID=A0A8H3UB76_VENIN|nr:hypothetical protein EG328_008993 [Venturia inaequalis]KAE9994831.1 hypothetical protein EG327_000044 [Venturia inaequalis]RDI83651.1 putative amino-acid permease [Venturia inaequalis]